MYVHAHHDCAMDSGPFIVYMYMYAKFYKYDDSIWLILLWGTDWPSHLLRSCVHLQGHPLNAQQSQCSAVSDETVVHCTAHSCHVTFFFFFLPFFQVLQERGESTSRHGRATFSVLLFQV